MKTRAWIVLAVLVCCLLVVVQSGQTAVIGIDSTLTDPVLTTGTGPNGEIKSFAVGANTYDRLTFLGPATAINNGNQTFTRIGNTDPDDTAAVAQELIGNGYLTDGKANASGVQFALGKTLEPGDETLFFMYELVLSTATAADDVVVSPLSGGVAIGDWSLTLNASDYGALSDVFRMTLLSSSDVHARGVTFTLDDFSGTGTLSGVDGLLFTDGGNTWDPLSVGMVEAVPEPSALAMVLSLAGIAMAGFLRRWRRS